jgi:glycosyltransferase involved in cell wall biosynthesis
MPAYNAARTLLATYQAIPPDCYDEIIVVDDASRDETLAVARSLNLTAIAHPQNRGYGANQKTCYTVALQHGADIVVMIHPDYQYEPRLAPALINLIASGVYDVALGSRILGANVGPGGMPRYKYLANRLLTFLQNLLLRQKLSEYHTGYRAFRREVLERLPLRENSDDFVFDNQILVQVMHFGYRVGEVSVPARYFPEASSIDFRRSLRYGLGVLRTTLAYLLHRSGLRRSRLFRDDGGGRLLPTVPATSPPASAPNA